MEAVMGHKAAIEAEQQDKTAPAPPVELGGLAARATGKELAALALEDWEATLRENRRLRMENAMLAGVIMGLALSIWIAKERGM